MGAESATALFGIRRISIKLLAAVSRGREKKLLYLQRKGGSTLIEGCEPCRGERLEQTLPYQRQEILMFSWAWRKRCSTLRGLGSSRALKETYLDFSHAKSARPIEKRDIKKKS